MRVVLDTNVLVSAALKNRSLPALAVRIASEESTLLKSAATEAQLFDVIARPYLSSLISQASRTWLETIMAAAEDVVIAQRVVACRDHTDDKFLELAVNGRADIVVTGDADLLVLNPFRGIPILAPASFVSTISR